MTDYNNPSEVEWGEHLDRIAEDQDEHAPVEPHHVEMYIADEFVSGKHNYGWQCFTKGCQQEGEDFSSFAEAEKAANEHVAEVSA